MDKQHVSFLIQSMLPIEQDKRFASLMAQYEPKEGIQYFAFTFHGTAPLINRKGMAITYPTHKNSLSSAIDTMVDYEHIAEDIGNNTATEVVGHISSLYVDDEDMPKEEPVGYFIGGHPLVDKSKTWVIPDIIPVTPIITRGVMALYTRMASVQNIAQSIRDGDTWYFSMEVGRNVTPPEIWVAGDGWEDDKIFTWSECPDDLREKAGEASEQYWNGRKIAYLMGGRNGQIQYIGGAITRRPAGYEQDAMNNPLKFICSMSDIPNSEQYEELKYSVWNSLKDVPERLKTMDGVPLTLAQINWVSRIAEGVGTTEKVNGWAVAKAKFKDEYTVKDGRWSKKTGSDDMTFKESIEKFKEYLIGKKDASVPEGFEPILIESVDELKEMVSYLKQFGGENMPNLTDEEYAKAIDDAKKAGLEEAKTAGIVVPKEELEGKYTQEEVDAMVAKGILKRERDSKIASMPVDEDLKKDLMKLASDEAEYPYNDEGKIKFDSVASRWSLAFAKKENKDTASMGDGNDKKDENFNPGSGNSNSSEDTIIPRVVIR